MTFKINGHWETKPNANDVFIRFAKIKKIPATSVLRMAQIGDDFERNKITVHIYELGMKVSDTFKDVKKNLGEAPYNPHALK